MYPLKQSTAIPVPIFVHDANGDAVTGLVDAGFTKRISKNGGAFAAMTVTITEMENGWYSVPISASHSDTLGVLSLTFTHASAKQVNLQFRVYARLPDDLAYPTTSGRSIDVTATGAVGIDWANVEGQGTSVNLSATTTNLVNTTTTNTDMRGTDSALLASSAPTNFGDLAITVTTGQVTVGTNNDKTGYSLTQAFPTNFADLSITATTGLVSVGTIGSGVITAGSIAAAALNGKGDWNVGKTGYSLSAAGVDAIFDEATAGHVTAGTFGVAITDILADTGDIQPKLGTPAASVSADIAAVKADSAAILIDTAEIGTAGAGLTDLGGMSTAMKAEVNAEALDVIATDTYAEPGQATPPATTALSTKIDYLYKAWRNKSTQTATTLSLFNDAGAVVDQKSTVSDDGTTFTRGEMATGP